MFESQLGSEFSGLSMTQLIKFEVFPPSNMHVLCTHVLLLTFLSRAAHRPCLIRCNGESVVLLLWYDDW